MSSIFDLIDYSNWVELRDYLYATDSLSKLSKLEMNEEGQNMFHAACSKCDIPSDIIILLFQVNIDALFILSKSNSLPIHYACETGSASTVKILLQLSDTFRQVRGPSNIDIRVQTTLLDINERTALDRAWLKYFVSNNSSCQKSASKVEHVYQNFQDMDNITSIRDLSGRLLDIWDKTVAILFSGCAHSAKKSSSWYIIHTIARSGGGDTCWCPSVVMWFALKMFGYQTCWKDEDGNLPIHIAASYPLHKILYISTNLGGKTISEKVNQPVIEMLTQYHPNSTKIRNVQKRLPLNLAIESQKCWKNGIKSLLRVNPSSLDICDSKTQLCPFMLAAASETVQAVQSEQFPFYASSSLYSKSDNSLDLVYRLLRSNPMNVMYGGY